MRVWTPFGVPTGASSEARRVRAAGPSRRRLSSTRRFAARAAWLGSMPIAVRRAFFVEVEERRCASVVPILTSRQLFKMNRSMYARIHQAA
jgi:hypothetical protein